jgi:hypothetical protein
MIDLTFLVFLSLYLLVGIKIDQWITISLLGFKSETPELFMTNPRIYDVVRRLIFAATAACLLGVSFAWYFGAGALLVAWLTTTWIGSRLAFNTFRAVCLDVAEHAKTEEDRTSALESARKSNAELRDKAMLMNKYGG